MVLTNPTYLHCGVAAEWLRHAVVFAELARTIDIYVGLTKTVYVHRI
jgi:hypothetical protein